MPFSDLSTHNTNVSNGSHPYTSRNVKTNFLKKFTILNTVHRKAGVSSNVNALGQGEVKRQSFYCINLNYVFYHSAATYMTF